MVEALMRVETSCEMLSSRTLIFKIRVRNWRKKDPLSKVPLPESS